MKKKNALMAKDKNGNTLKDVEEQSRKKIEKGLNKKTASTGTPIARLGGGAKFMAQLSNIGGGSKATGGKGIADGFNTIVQNQNAKTAIGIAKRQELESSKGKAMLHSGKSAKEKQRR